MEFNSAQNPAPGQVNYYRQLRSEMNDRISKGETNLRIQNGYVVPPNEANFSEEEKVEFMSLYPKVRQDLTNIEPYNKFPCFMKNIGSMLDYNVTCGTNARGLQLIYAYKMMAKPEDRTSENIKLAILLGWSLRLYEASVIVLDDFLDNSVIRHKRPCWYSLPQVGKTSSLHAAFIESSAFYIMHKYLSNHPRYTNMMDILLRVAFYVNYCQSMDVFPYEEKNQTYEYMMATCVGKSAWCLFYVGVTIAMHHANITDPVLYEKMKKILMTMGYYYQMQNDFLDSFDNPKNRQLGADIKEARITWLSAVAYNRCNPIQKRFFNENFGKESNNSVNKIISLYEELEMPKVYEDAECKLHSEISADISTLPNDVIPHILLFRLLNNLQQRLCSA